MLIYKPLSTTDPSEIRVIKLYPGNLNDQIRCEIEHVSLEAEDMPMYAALSYHWGDPNGNKTILLNGQDHLVTANLFAFLQHAQSILLTITQCLPAALRRKGSLCDGMIQSIVYDVLQDTKLPLDILFAPSSELEDLVKNMIMGAYSQAYSPGEAQYEETRSTLLSICENTDIPPEPDACFLRLWVDALCINQPDLAERSQQVGRMRDIYSSASFLLIWPLDCMSSQLSSDAYEVASLVRFSRLPLDLYRSQMLENDEKSITLANVMPRYQDFQHEIEQLQHLFKEPWFSRIWVIQELATAKAKAKGIMLLGFFPVSWDILASAIPAFCELMILATNLRMMTAKFVDISKTIVTLRDLEHDYNKSEEVEVAQRLHQLLRQTGGVFKATMPHDYLYALLGLIKTAKIPREIYPDYTTPFEMVFHHYAVYLINNTKDLGCLACWKNELCGVPTWVPDWRFALRHEFGSNYEYLDSPDINIVNGGSCLEVDGIVLGTVITVVHLTYPGLDKATVWTMSDLTILNILKQYEEMCIKDIDAVAPDISIYDFEHHWIEFWVYFRYIEKLRGVYKKLSSNEDLSWEYSEDSDMCLMMIAMRNELLRVSGTGVGILEDSAVVSIIQDAGSIQVNDVLFAGQVPLKLTWTKENLSKTMRSGDFQ